MEKQALIYIQNALDKATQKGAFNLQETANIVSALELLNKLVNPDLPEQEQE